MQRLGERRSRHVAVRRREAARRRSPSGNSGSRCRARRPCQPLEIVAGRRATREREGVRRLIVSGDLERAAAPVLDGALILGGRARRSRRTARGSRTRQIEQRSALVCLRCTARGCPAEACVAPAATVRASKSSTRAPREASSRATAQPMIPPPTTMTSAPSRIFLDASGAATLERVHSAGQSPWHVILRGDGTAGRQRLNPRGRTMPRRARLSDGLRYHVVNRGNRRRRSFANRLITRTF